MRRSLLLITVLLLGAGPLAGASASLLADPGFEGGSLGAMTTANSAWEVQRTGADTTAFVVERIADPAVRPPHGGSRCCFMSLPLAANPAAFDHTTVGQRLALQAGVIYEAAAWVRWTNTDNGNDSAIVSFWAQHQADRTFAGKDVWLRDGAWTRLAFRFQAVRPEQPVFVYLSLLPHQTPRRTDLLIDDFTLTAVGSVGALPPPAARELVVDGGFEAQALGQPPAGAWTLYRSSPAQTAIVQQQDGSRVVRLGIPAGTGNTSEVRLQQAVNLEQGRLYDISCSIRWNNYSGPGDTGLVNWILYHPASNTFYGPIDHRLDRGDWHRAPFVHGACASGQHLLYVQVFGWGNFGDAMDLSFDDLSIRPRGAPLRSIRMQAPAAGLHWELLMPGSAAPAAVGLEFPGLDPRLSHLLAPVPVAIPGAAQ